MNGVNWHLTNGQNSNWKLKNGWKSKWQLTFVVGIHWQLTKGWIALNILKTECKIRSVYFFCPIKVRFLLHISKSTPECHISLIITAWTIHINLIYHISVKWSLIPNSIVNLRDGLQFCSFKSCCRLLSNWFGKGIWASQKPRSINDVNTVLAQKIAPYFVPWSKRFVQ